MAASQNDEDIMIVKEDIRKIFLCRICRNVYLSRVSYEQHYIRSHVPSGFGLSAVPAPQISHESQGENSRPRSPPTVPDRPDTPVLQRRSETIQDPDIPSINRRDFRRSGTPVLHMTLGSIKTEKDKSPENRSRSSPQPSTSANLVRAMRLADIKAENIVEYSCVNNDRAGLKEETEYPPESIVFEAVAGSSSVRNITSAAETCEVPAPASIPNQSQNTSEPAPVVAPEPSQGSLSTNAIGAPNIVNEENANARVLNNEPLQRNNSSQDMSRFDFQEVPPVATENIFVNIETPPTTPDEITDTVTGSGPNANQTQNEPPNETATEIPGTPLSKPYACNFCSTSFVRDRTLHFHIKHAHQQNLEWMELENQTFTTEDESNVGQKRRKTKDTNKATPKKRKSKKSGK